MDLDRLVAFLYLTGCLLVAVGVGFFDWRLGLICAGLSLVVPSLTLGDSE